jgi:hypothetical protein
MHTKAAARNDENANQSEMVLFVSKRLLLGKKDSSLSNFTSNLINWKQNSLGISLGSKSLV